MLIFLWILILKVSIVACCAAVGSLGVAYYLRLSYCWFPQNAPTTFKRILLINCTAECTEETLSFFRICLALREQGNTVTVLVKTNSWLEQQCKQARITYYHCNSLFYFGESYIESIVKKHLITILHCSNFDELQAAQKVVKNKFIRIIFGKSSMCTSNLSLVQNLDGLLTLNSSLDGEISPIKSFVEGHSFVYKKDVPPLGDYMRYASQPTLFQHAYDYFLNFIGPHYKHPYVLSLGTFEDGTYNYILEAAAFIIQCKKIPIHLLFFTNTPEPMVTDYSYFLGIADFIHFLPFQDDISSALYHATMVISHEKKLTTNALIQAALLKKPLLIPCSLPKQNFIINETTALIFNTLNPASLASAMLKILNNKAYAQELGNNAHKYVIEHTTLTTLSTSLHHFYDLISKKSGMFI